MTGVSPTVFEKMANNWVQQQLAQLEGQKGSPSDMMNVAMRPPQSTGAYETYAWLGDVPLVKEWVGEKKARGLKDYDFKIKNAAFYDAIQVDRNDLRDDKIGAHEIRIRDLVTRMEQYKRTIISALITAGDTALAYDGVAFFANSGAVRKNDNLLAGSNVDTLAHIETDIETGIVTMATFKDEEDEPLNLVPDTIVCPVVTMLKFERIVASTGDPGQTNPAIKNPFARFGFTVIGDPRLDADDATDWYMFCTKGLLKPFILQEREAIRSVLDDTKVKSERMYYYSVEWDGNGGYGLPILGLKFVNS